jgi:hypothetical protein
MSDAGAYRKLRPDAGKDLHLLMFLYNVTVGIDKDVEGEWLTWIRHEFIPQVMETQLFVDFKIYKVLHDDDEGTVSYSILFFADSLDKVTAYFEHYAPTLTEKHRARFMGKHAAFMTLLEEV